MPESQNEKKEDAPKAASAKPSLPPEAIRSETPKPASQPTRNDTQYKPSEVLRVARERAGVVYDKTLTPLAKKYLFELPNRLDIAAARPTILLLGNHSSGKSTFINYLLNEEVQRTGLAPVDDGFTIITWGDARDELSGPAVVSHADYPYSDLQRFGPTLVSHIAMKFRPIALLKDITLIDSPGMIDSIEAGDNRGYDFLSVIEDLAQTADAVLLFFDPDKPGTTGETLTALRASLTGIDHKLLIVMNKVDRFDTIRDFARAYGALCWNLAKVIHRKDMPHIYNMFIPVGEKRATEPAFPLDDFERSRDEVVDAVKQTPQRRASNIVAQLYAAARGLSIHTRVASRIARDMAGARLKYYLLIALTLITTGAMTWLIGSDIASTTGWRLLDWLPAAYMAFGGLAVAGVVYGVSVWDDRNREKTLADDLDGVFNDVFGKELALRATNEDLDIQAIWQSVKPGVLRALNVIGIRDRSLLFPDSLARRALEKAIETTIPEIQADVARIGMDEKSRRLNPAGRRDDD
jgi:GTPase SAR1 family protein